MTSTRPVPHPDRDSAPWWAALARHELLLQRCSQCATWRWPAREICNRCGSFEYTWSPVSGRGSVASWIVNHHPFASGVGGPYAVVLVRLDEQDDCKLIGSFTGPIAALRTGLEVRAVFDDVDDGVTLLAWQPAGPQEGRIHG